MIRAFRSLVGCILVVMTTGTADAQLLDTFDRLERDDRRVLVPAVRPRGPINATIVAQGLGAPRLPFNLDSNQGGT